MIKVILDTNFLVYCANQKIDYAADIMKIMKEGYELIVLSQVVDELKDLSKNAEKYSERQAAKLALKLLKHNKICVIRTEKKYADKALLSMAAGNIIATLDLELRKKLRESRIIVIKGVKKLAFD